MELFNMPNVRIGTKEQVFFDNSLETPRTRKILADIATIVLREYPKWTLTFTLLGHGENATNRALLNFDVSYGEEQLGSVCSTYAHALPALEVKNHRISAQRLRSGGYKTTSVDKAFKKIKQTFKPMSYVEHIRKATDVVELAYNRICNKAMTDFNINFQAVGKAGQDFLLGEGYGQFLVYLETRSDIPRGVSALENSVLHMQTIQQLRESRTTKKQVVVVILNDDGTGEDVYIALNRGSSKTNDFNRYTSETLPEELRVKIGLLKLSNDETFVADVGLRKATNVFSVLLD
jgi:hypothetical protein